MNVYFIQLYIIYRFHFYHQNWARKFCSNTNGKLLKGPSKNNHLCQPWVPFMQNPLDLVSLHIINIEQIICMEIYNICIYLFIINKIVKVKVGSHLKCVSFVNVLWSIWREFHYDCRNGYLTQKNIFHTELMCVKFPRNAPITNAHLLL